MTAAQTLMVATTVLLGGVAIGALIYRAALNYLRDIYNELGIPFTDAELAASIEADEQAWAEWVDICGVLDIDPNEGTPLLDRLVCMEIERAEGWSA